LSNAARRAAKGADALRRGWPVRIGALDLLAVESADAATLADFGGTDLLISGERAVTLKPRRGRCESRAQGPAWPPR
jgi:GTP cyclohydrolase II